MKWHHRMMQLVVQALFFSWTVLSAGAQQAPPVPVVSAVTTVEIPDSIRSWGRLGGIAIDRLGFLYMSNFGNSVWRITPDGDAQLLADGLYGASGNTIGPDGALYQGSFFDNTVWRIDRTGAAEPWATNIPTPVGMVTQPDGTLFVVSCGTNSLFKVNPDRTLERVLQSNLFACPNGIATGPDGLYIVSFSNDDIVRIDNDGKASVFATVGSGNGNAHIARVGRHFFVTKIKTHELWRVGPNGETVRFLGQNGPGHADGPPAAASITNPNGITAGAGPLGPLYLNTIVGRWGTTAPARLTIRRIQLVPEGS